jgi:dimethylhistidine N-methyltransferase
VSSSPLKHARPGTAESLLGAFRRVRSRSEALAAPLSPEDMGAQSMPDASPIKWHLAHTTWFFEQIILGRQPGYTSADPRFDTLFNSYYESLGPRVARHARGLITRPDVAGVMAYRRAVDTAIEAWLATPGALADTQAAYLFDLALNHEEQHQELILTDLLHLFAQSPLKPAYRSAALERAGEGGGPLGWVAFDGGRRELGWACDGFAFDNEAPRHPVWVQDFALADRLVTNAEWLGFMADGGYTRPELWMSDGWAEAKAEGWSAPMYWTQQDGAWSSMTLYGEQPIDPTAPVVHISWYEADAFARWAGCRLPTEAEWEVAAGSTPVTGNLADAGSLCPLAADPDAEGLRQMFGDVWEWTASAYAPYPGFRPTPGTAAEYNGKFMANQMVLRGGSFATPDGHIRSTYRNFFYPKQRWQFCGVRLARDDAEPRNRGRTRSASPEFGQALLAGLTRSPKATSPKWFYDEAGSDLFEAITELPEYYPTRTEIALLKSIAPEVVSMLPDDAVLVELGSGASVKTGILLGQDDRIHTYVPVDISESALAGAAKRIREDFPKIVVRPVVADFTQAADLGATIPAGARVGFFPGSTIGNFDPAEALALLRSTRALLGSGSLMIIGVDLAKDEATLTAAYDDAQGVTARFNKNLLVRANRELGADFNLDAFGHRAVWNAAESRMEMHLVSLCDQMVRLEGRTIVFRRDETIHTENSYKFTIDGFEALAKRAGWSVRRQWTSPAPRFAIFLLES